MQRRLLIGYVVVIAAAFGGHFVLPEPLASACYLIVSLLAVLAVPVGLAIYRPASVRPWITLGLAQALFLLGDGVWYAAYSSGGSEPPFPSIADPIYLAGYPLLAAGVIMFIRARQPRYRLTAALDALIVGIAAVLILWLTVIDGVVHDETIRLVERLVAVAYPVGDALILSATVYLLMSGRHGRGALWMLVSSMVALLAADLVFATVADTSLASMLSDAFWLLSYASFGLAALLPSMAQMAEPSESPTAPESAGRLIAIGVAIAVLPIFAIVQRLFGENQDLPLVGIAGVVIIAAILFRMRELGAVLGRSEHRYASLLANASDAFAIVQQNGRFTYASPASDRVLGYQAGETIGRSALEFVQPRAVPPAIAALRRVSELPGAQEELELDQLAIDYQPIVRLRDGALVGAEALLRWSHSERGQVPVAETLELAEAAGLTVELNAWVLEQACREARAWVDSRPRSRATPPPFVAVNASTRILLDPAYAELVGAALARHHLPPASLTIEITESDLMQDSEAAIGALGRLRELGVRLAIDDFGTGYSSLAYLARFPLDVLKVDRAFVSTITSAEDGTIARAIVELARSLHMSVIAEGIETAHQRAAMAGMGVDYGQGFFLGRPLAAAGARDLFRALIVRARRPSQRSARSTPPPVQTAAAADA